MTVDGTALKARPTTYNGIQMRSRLEAKYAQWLDRLGVEWEYEPKCFASTEGQYLPDFVIRRVRFMDIEGDAYVEVKPLASMFPPARMKEVASIIWASAPSALFILDAADSPWLAVFSRSPIIDTSCWGVWTISPDRKRLVVAPTLPRDWRGL